METTARADDTPVTIYWDEDIVPGDQGSPGPSRPGPIDPFDVFEVEMSADDTQDKCDMSENWADEDDRPLSTTPQGYRNNAVRVETLGDDDGQ